MTQEEIITRLIERLDFHLDNGWPVHQDYKNYIFKLFREAYDSGYCEHPSSPLLTGDALRDILQDRWDTGGTETEAQRQKTQGCRPDDVERMAVCLAPPLAPICG